MCGWSNICEKKYISLNLSTLVSMQYRSFRCALHLPGCHVGNMTIFCIELSSLVESWKALLICLSYKSCSTVSLVGLQYILFLGWESLNLILGNTRKIQKKNIDKMKWNTKCLNQEYSRDGSAVAYDWCRHS